MPSNTHSVRVSAIVPARNEEAVIGACVQSLAKQAEISEVIVVDDQSTDRTAAVVTELSRSNSKVRLLQLKELPAGWVGKNNAVWQGAQVAIGDWLLFTDADAVHNEDSATQALAIAQRENAALISFSPEQIMVSWYEKALIPYVYCRLSSHFSFAEVNDPLKNAAAANGQFLMIRRDAYESVGGHASVAGEILEDVALASRVKQAAYRIWFGSGQGIVCVRMYRSFGAMMEGWKKNLYPLMGGGPETLGREFVRSAVPVYATLIAATTAGALLENWLTAIGILVAGFVIISVADDGELRRSGFSHRLVWYGIPGRLLFARALLGSYRGHRKGKLKWKGREYPAGTSRASNG
jgi:glycosyltransferase involved in cell wall biosynthesis